MGRGEWVRCDARRTVESTLGLDIRSLVRTAQFLTGRPHALAWSGGCGSRAVHARMENDSSAFVTFTSDGVCSVQRLAIDWTAPHLGGRRPWWRCPECERRCAIVYLDGLRFRCRTCAGLTHLMSQLSKAGRPMRQAVMRRHRLGWSLCEPFPRKPRGMHRRTWERLLEAYRPAVLAASEAYGPRLERLEEEHRTLVERSRRRLQEFGR